MNIMKAIKNSLTLDDHERNAIILCIDMAMNDARMNHKVCAKIFGDDSEQARFWQGVIIRAGLIKAKFCKTAHVQIEDEEEFFSN